MELRYSHGALAVIDMALNLGIIPPLDTFSSYFSLALESEHGSGEVVAGLSFRAAVLVYSGTEHAHRQTT